MKDILLYLRVILGSHKYLWISVPVVAVIVWFLGLFLFDNTILINLSKLNDITAQAERDQLLFSLASRSKLELTILFTTLLPLVNLFFIKNLFQKDYYFSIPISIVKKFIALILLGIIIYILNFIVISLLNFGLGSYLQHNYFEELMQGYEKAGYLYYRIRDDSIFYNGLINLENLKNGYIYLIILPAYYVMILYFKKYSLLIFTTVLIICIPMFIININKIGDLFGLNQSMSYKIHNDVLTGYYKLFLYLLSAVIFNFSFYMLLKDKEI